MNEIVSDIVNEKTLLQHYATTAALRQNRRRKVSEDRQCVHIGRWTGVKCNSPAMPGAKYCAQHGDHPGRCTATAKQSGERCCRKVVPGMTKCSIHGGKSLKGTMSKLLTGAKYTRYLPANLAENVSELLDNPEWTTLKEESALLEARLIEIIKQIDDHPVDFDALSSGMMMIESAAASADMDLVLSSVETMKMLVARGLQERQLWDDITSIIEARRKLVETERKQANVLGAMVPVEQVMLLATRLLAIVNANVEDQTALKKIRADFNKTFMSGSRPQIATNH
jgi:hypothetical protein